MARFTKTVLKVGKYHSPDGVVDVTEGRLRHWAEQHKRLREANQVVPIAWDHASNVDDLSPVALDQFSARSAKNTVGHLKEFNLSADGRSAELVLDVHDDVAISKASSNSVFVSPVILNRWRDGAANEYSDVITHVDFVNHPVDHSQGPFVADAITCGLRLGLSQPHFLKATRMAKASKSNDKNSYHWITTPDGDPVLAPPVGRGKGNRSKRKGNKKMSLLVRRLADSEPMEEPTDDSTPDGYDNMDEILDLLEEHFNIVVPEDTTDENLVERLHAAILTACAHKNADNPAESPEAKEEVTVADTGASTLSLEQRGAIEWAQRHHRADVEKRLAAVLDSGRCTPAEFQTRKEGVSTVRLSLDGQGNPVLCDLEKWIADRETIPQGTFWDSKKRTEKAGDVTTARLSMSAESIEQEDAAAIAAWAMGGKRPNHG